MYNLAINNVKKKEKAILFVIFRFITGSFGTIMLYINANNSFKLKRYQSKFRKRTEDLP